MVTPLKTASILSTVNNGMWLLAISTINIKRREHNTIKILIKRICDLAFDNAVMFPHGIVKLIRYMEVCQ